MDDRRFEHLSLSRPQRNLTGERLCFGRSTNLVSLSRPGRNLINERRRRCCFERQKRIYVYVHRCCCFGRIIHGRANIILTLVEALKESRQKRLDVKHRKYNLKTAILQYYIDRTANRLISLGGTNLDSLSSRKHTTTYVQSNLARPAHLGTQRRNS